MDGLVGAALSAGFDYIENKACQFGGQSFGVALYSGYGEATRTRLVTRLLGYGTAGGAINAGCSSLDEVANRERYREYDHSPGFGFGAEALLTRDSTCPSPATSPSAPRGRSSAGTAGAPSRRCSTGRSGTTEVRLFLTWDLGHSRPRE